MERMWMVWMGVSMMMCAVGCQDDEFKGMRVICVGCSSGIGKSAAKILVERGADVVISSRRENVCKEAVEEILSLPHQGQLYYFVADANSPSDMNELADFARGKFNGPVTSFVWAPTGTSFGMFDALKEDVIEAMTNQYQTNVLSFVRFFLILLPDLEATRGSVVTVSSIASEGTYLGLVPYGQAKAAQDHVMMELALEYGPKGIRLNSVLPATIVTPLFDAFGPVRDTFLERVEGCHALERNGQPDEVGEPIAFLLSPKASFITGHLLRVDGGSKLKTSHWDSFTFTNPNYKPYKELVSSSSDCSSQQ